MKICVIGGSGHIGQNLVGRLLDEGYQVTVLTTGRTALPTHGKWDTVTAVQYTYRRDDPDWAACLQAIGAEVVIDLLGADAPATYAAIKGQAQQLIVCGSVWMFGAPRVVPTPPTTQGPCPFDGYAQRYQEMQDIKAQAAREGFPFTAIMPPNICGPGKVPLEGHGGRSLEVHRAHQRSEPVILPEPGQTLIGPCDAADVAQAFFLAVQQREAAADEIFNVGSAYALTARQFVATYGEIYGVEIPIEWVSWEEFSTKVRPDPGAHFHFLAHMCPDLSKTRAKLGYAPRYTPEESMERAVAWMREEGMI